MSLRWSSATDQLYAVSNSSPSLDLDFASNKSLLDNISGSPLANHQRDASSGKSAGTYVGSDGLIKTTHVNLLTYSEKFDNASWVKTNVSVTANSVAAPDGTFTADFLAENTAAGLHQLETSSNLYTAVVNEPYTYSIYVKPNGRNEIGLGYRDAGLTIFNLSTNSITIVQHIGAGGSITNNSIEALSNGWYRISSTIVDQATYGRRAEVFLCNSGSSSYTGNGSSGAYVWGYQVEEGTAATAYIPTTNLPSGAPRFDHDPVTGESLGLLIEEARTNFNPNSAATYNGWANVTANSVLAPDGTFTAAALQPPASSNPGGAHELYAVFPNVGAVNVGNTVTVYARRNPGSAMKYLTLRLFTSGWYNYYNLETGQVVVNNPDMPGSMTSVGNGWWRCQLTNNTSAGATYSLRTFVSTVPSIAPQTNGDPVYLWGVQNEAGSFPTSYIPTAGTTETRAADIASITGANFSSWYNQSEGTAFAEYDGLKDYARVLDLGNGNPFITSRPAINAAYDGVTETASDADLGLTLGDTRKSVTAYSGTTTTVTISGLVPRTGNSDFTSTTNTVIYLGGQGNNVNVLNGHITRLAYYPYRLSDTILQEITS